MTRFFKNVTFFFNFKAIYLSSSSLLFLFGRVDSFIWKLISPIRSETTWKTRSLAPLEVSYERFLYNSVIAFFSIEVSSPKNIPSAHRNWRERNPWEFVSLNILHNWFKFIFSSPSGTSPSGTINKKFVKGNFPLR